VTADPADLWPGHVSRSASFENPTAGRSAGGTAFGGRKGAPNRRVEPGETVVLADVTGPGRLTHLWVTIGTLAGGARPLTLRGQRLEVFYDGGGEPSVSVPVPDLFGAVHGVCASYGSTLTAVNERRGFSSRVPMPFGAALRMTYTNESDTTVVLYYQADFLMGSGGAYLHAAFRRENLTTPGDDFEIVPAGLTGPGRYLGATIGVRILDQEHWWGEGEVKVYLDGETTPTICGTGTEDYLDSAWGLGEFAAPESGAPVVRATDRARQSLVSAYRWHVSDAIVFERSVRVTIQQIGAAMSVDGAPPAGIDPTGPGWQQIGPATFGLFERADDWCATGFVYCATPQPVARYDTALATADLPDR
jgi:hypothetical protein